MKISQENHYKMGIRKREIRKIYKIFIDSYFNYITINYFP